jgi:hypothetical protein
LTTASRHRLQLAAIAAVMAALIGLSSTPAAALTTRWPAAERYALSLLNCTRTGGWVKKDGTCIDRGSGKHSQLRKPLKVKVRLADNIARPQARRVARAGYLDHDLGGSILKRFARAGIHCCAMGESLGHYEGKVKDAVLAVHLMIQAEKGTGGWHWRNLKDKRFTFVGIGVWVKGNDVWVAYDFWDGR